MNLRDFIIFYSFFKFFSQIYILSLNHILRIYHAGAFALVNHNGVFTTVRLNFKDSLNKIK